MKISKLVVIFALTLNVAPALAVDTCVDQTLSGLRSGLQQSIQTRGLTPALAFEGKTRAEADELERSGRSTTAFIDRAFAEMSAAVRAFSAAPSVGGAARAVFGNQNQRQRLQILRRANSPTAVPGATKAACEGQPCDEIAISMRQLYVVNASADKVADRFSVFKFETVRGFDVFFCEYGAGCANRVDLQRASGRVLRTETPSPAAFGKEYALREVIKGAPQGAIDSTSLLKITPLAGCGGKAYLFSSVQIGSGNTFEDASLQAVLFESQGKTLVYGLFQGKSSYANGPLSKIFNGLTSGIAVGSLAAAYNAQAESLQSQERVSKDGVLK